MYAMDPFYGLGSPPFGYFVLMLLGGLSFSCFPPEDFFVHFFLSFVWLNLLHGRKQRNSGLEMHDVGYVY